MERVWLEMGTLSWVSMRVLSWEIVMFGLSIVTLSSPSLLLILIIILPAQFLRERDWREYLERERESIWRERDSCKRGMECIWGKVCGFV